MRDGVRVQAFAHVGRIQLGELLITVEPKIGTSELLGLLRYAYGLRNLQLFEKTDFAHTRELLQDLLAAQLLAEVTELVGRGLAKKYVPRSEELASPRGQIDFGIVIRRGPAASSTLPCRHHLRSSDHHLNRIIRAGVELAANIAQETGLRRSLHRLSFRLGDGINSLRLGVGSLARAWSEVNRLTAAYVPALRLTELLHACAAVSLDGEATAALPGFLFDMNRFFQELMGRFLADHLPAYRIRQEHALTEMMRYMPGLNPRHRRSPTPRPDFVVMKGTTTICLLDAKYRDLWERDLPREMLYQLAIYALSQQKPSTATILFPTVSADATPAKVEIRDPSGTGVLGFVELRPVILSKLVEALAGSHAVREALASHFAFGLEVHELGSELRTSA
jgi:5-methylcytosine-specific restriction enzyme subunit McrC